MADNQTVWARRGNNSNKLSLSTPSSGQNDSPPSGRNGSVSQRRGGDSSSYGNRNYFDRNGTTTPGGGLTSPSVGGASGAFALGMGALSFGGGKTPKSPGNPFDGLKTPGVEKSAKDVTAPSSSSRMAVKPATNNTPNKPVAHQLRDSWVFWFRPPIPKNAYVAYDKTVHPVALCSTAEEYFAVYDCMKRPSTLSVVSDYHFFKKGIRPIWEDNENMAGGKWIVRLKKGLADRYWEDLTMALIGDQFGDVGEHICGAVMSVRNGEDILSIWTNTRGPEAKKIRDMLKQVLSFPPDTVSEFKDHDLSIQGVIEHESSHKNKGHKAIKHQGDDTSKQAAQGS